jgi:hypothetical protein
MSEIKRIVVNDLQDLIAGLRHEGLSGSDKTLQDAANRVVKDNGLKNAGAIRPNTGLLVALHQTPGACGAYNVVLGTVPNAATRKAQGGITILDFRCGIARIHDFGSPSACGGPVRRSPASCGETKPTYSGSSCGETKPAHSGSSCGETKPTYSGSACGGPTRGRAGRGGRSSTGC